MTKNVKLSSNRSIVNCRLTSAHETCTLSLSSSTEEIKRYFKKCFINFLRFNKKRYLCERTRQVHVLDIICSSYFCGYALLFVSQRYIGYPSHGLLQLCNNLDLAVREAIAFLILTTQIS